MACLPELEEEGCVVFTSTVDLMKEYTTEVILEVTESGPCLALSTDYCEQDYLKRQRGRKPTISYFSNHGKDCSGRWV